MTIISCLGYNRINLNKLFNMQMLFINSTVVAMDAIPNLPETFIFYW